MTYREYLRSHKDTRHLAKILMDVGKGLKELQGIGYVHRDLKPENIVVNLRPLQVKIIDFNRSYPVTQSTKGTVRGTPGYYPMGQDTKDGSILWDIWAFCAIILESDMEVDAYVRVMSERGALFKAEKYMEEKSVSTYLKQLVRGTLLRAKLEDMLTLDRIMVLLQQIQWTKR